MQKISPLFKFQSFSHGCKIFFLESCTEEFIRFLCESIAHLIKEKLQSMKRNHSRKFQYQVRLFNSKRITWKQRREFLASRKGLQLLKSFLLPTLTISLDMQQFFIVAASVYNNKSLSTQAVTKQELRSVKFNKIPRTKLTRLRKK